MKNHNGDEQLPAGFRKIISPATGKTTYLVCAAKIGDTKIRKNFGEVTFGSAAEAFSAAKRWYADKRAELRSDKASVLSISDHNRLAYLEAIKRLEPYNKTILQAVNAAIEFWQQETVNEPITVKDAYQRFLAHKRLENCRPSYLRDIEYRFQAVAGEFGTRLVNEITGADLIEFLQDKEIGPVTWNNWRRNLRVFFSFCLEENNRWVLKNPALAIPEKKVDEEEVEILSLDQARKLLKIAMQSYPRQVPWLVLGMFAGMRRNEAQAAQWEDVLWDQNVIKVRSSKLRSVSTRYVELTEAALSFLTIFKGSGSIATGLYARRNELKELSEKSGIDCSKNLYRHSFGSYHLAAHQNRHMTMDQMGHENLQTFVRFYRRPIPRLIAEAYWLIRPQNLH